MPHEPGKLISDVHLITTSTVPILHCITEHYLIQSGKCRKLGSGIKSIDDGDSLFLNCAQGNKSESVAGKEGSNVRCLETE